MFKKAFILSLLTLCCLAPSAFAVQYDIKTMTPEVQQALNGRKSRFDTLQNLKAQGAVGETSRGYVEAIQGASQASGVVSAENADRRVIYKTIVQQNGLPASALAQVESAFGDVQRDRARSGDYIQSSSGAWVRK